MQKYMYRVVCSKETFKDDVFVDIAPANGVTHEMIYNSRLKKNPKVLDMAGSIYLNQIENNEPELVFTRHQGLPKNNELYRYYMRLYERLTPIILKRFNQMKEYGLEATLNVNSMSQSFDLYNMKRPPMTPQEERWKLESERKSKILENKRRTMQDMARLNEKHSPQTLMAWKQAQYRGD